MKIFIICPVRSADLRFVKEIIAYVAELESQGHIVIYPARDTEQEGAELDICRSNAEHIRSSDRVDIFYEARSQGVHFDLGTAFALGVPIKLVKVLYPRTLYYKKQPVEKTFLSMITEWEREVNNAYRFIGQDGIG